MEQEKRILIRKQFEISSNKDKKNVILYLLDMGYDNKDLTEILGVNVKKIYNSNCSLNVFNSSFLNI